MAAYPDISKDELAGRFISGSGIAGADLQAGCIEKSWDEQQQQFARFLLFEFCALYESWCESSLRELSAPAALSKDLQHPTSLNGKGHIQGIRKAIQNLNASTSSVMTSVIHPAIQSNKKNSPAFLENLLTCYRYSKELRNAMVHGSAGNFPDAELKYSIETATSMGVKERPQSMPQTAGEEVHLSLRGVVGFGEVVLRLISTLDVELSKSSLAEAVFINRWQKSFGTVRLDLPRSGNKRKNRIRGAVKKIGLPSVTVTNAFDSWLVGMNLIR